MTQKMRSLKVSLLQPTLHHQEEEVLAAVEAEVARVATEEQLRSMTITISHLCDEQARMS